MDKALLNERLTVLGELIRQLPDRFSGDVDYFERVERIYVHVVNVGSRQHVVDETFDYAQQYDYKVMVARLKDLIEADKMAKKIIKQHKLIKKNFNCFTW